MIIVRFLVCELLYVLQQRLRFGQSCTSFSDLHMIKIGKCADYPVRAPGVEFSIPLPALAISVVHKLRTHISVSPPWYACEATLSSFMIKKKKCRLVNTAYLDHCAVPILHPKLDLPAALRLCRHLWAQAISVLSSQ